MTGVRIEPAGRRALGGRRAHLRRRHRDRARHLRGGTADAGRPSTPARCASTGSSPLDDDGRVLGWAAASAVSDRCVYAGVIEHSVYVDPAARGRGVGRALLDALLDSAAAGGVWTVQSGIFPENSASIALHTAAGFRVVGTRERLGRMTYGPLAGQWRDVVLMERRLATDA